MSAALPQHRKLLRSQRCPTKLLLILLRDQYATSSRPRVFTAPLLKRCSRRSVRDLEYEDLARACNRSYFAVKEELDALSVPELLSFTPEEARLLAGFNVSVPVGRFVCSEHLHPIRAAHLRRVLCDSCSPALLLLLLLAACCCCCCCCCAAAAAALLLLP
jgi:hypothetical protein